MAALEEKRWHRAPIAKLRRQARLQKVAREHLAATIGIVIGSGSFLAYYLNAPDFIVGLLMFIGLTILTITHFCSRS